MARATSSTTLKTKTKSLKTRRPHHTVTATWPAGCESPSGLAIDIAGNRLFPVCDGNKMSVIDSASGKILATPAIGDGPDAARYSAKHKLAFASCGEGMLSVVDASHLQDHRVAAHQSAVRAPWPMTPPPTAPTW